MKPWPLRWRPQGGNARQLTSLVAARREAKVMGRKVRIAYFGNSMIEDGLVTGDLRNSLQKTCWGP